jgi:predicted Zn-dependent peptidase
MTHRFAFLLLAAAAATLGPARAEELPVRVEEKVLPNGLKVLAVRRAGVPQAACALLVKSGASSERPGRTGLAHVLEHMMFMGTETVGVKDPQKDKELLRRVDALTAEILALQEEREPDEERLAGLRQERDRLFREQMENVVNDAVDKIYEEAGSSMTNAWTGEDATTFFTLLPPHRIELFFWMESRRFRAPVFRQFHAELDVVREERRLADNRPGDAYLEELNRAVFGSHPYAHPILGYPEDLARLAPEDLREFFETHYTPDNMVVLVGGDVDPAEVFRLAETYFAGLPRAGRQRPPLPVLPIPKAGSVRVYGRGAGTPSLSVIHKLPPAGWASELECEIVALSLGDRDGALRKTLVDEKGVATDLSAWYDNRRHGGVLWIEVAVAPGRAPAEAEGDVLQAVRKIADAPLSAEEVKRLARRYRSGLLGAFKDDFRIGYALLGRESVGSWRELESLLSKVNEVRAEDVRKVAAEYLVPENRVVGHYEEGKEEPGPETGPGPEEPEPPAANPAYPGPADLKDLPAREKAFEVPEAGPLLETLPNGIRVIAVPDPDDPVFRIEAFLEGGSAEDPAGQEGLARLLSAVAGESGIPGMGRKALRERLEDLVAESGTGHGLRSLSVSLNAFRAQMPEGLALFQDLLLRRALDAETLKPEREAAKASLVDEDADPESVSSRTYEELLWGKVPRTRRPTAASLDAIGAEDLARSLAARLDPRRCVIAVSGPFERSAMVSLLGHAFGGWKAPAGPVPAPVPSKASPSAPGLYVMDFDTSQGYVFLGVPTVSRRDPDYPLLALASTVLSRRVYERIRSSEGLAYSAYAWLSPDWELPSLFTIEFQTKTASVPWAISLALEEMKRIAEKAPEAAELDLARKELLASLRGSLGKASDRARTFAVLAVDAPGDLGFHRRYWKAAEAATAEAVRAACSRHLVREKLRLLCVGAVDEMEDGDGKHPVHLADFGEAKALEPPAAPGAPTSPREVALFLVRKISQGDVEAVKPHLSKAMRKEFEKPGALDELAAQGKMLAQAKSEVTRCEEKGEKAAVSVRFSLEMGGQAMDFTLEFRLIREEGKWVCEDIQPRE